MTKDYRVASPVHHNGRRYDEGDCLSVDDVEAKPLLAVGAITFLPVVEVIEANPEVVQQPETITAEAEPETEPTKPKGKTK